jgi:hypothetical protein
MSDTTGRSPRWMPATGDHSDRQLHAMEFIASSLDRIDGHLERIAASVAGSGAHKPFGEALGGKERVGHSAASREGSRFHSTWAYGADRTEHLSRRADHETARRDLTWPEA